MKRDRKCLCLLALLYLMLVYVDVHAQTSSATPVTSPASTSQSTYNRIIDPINGRTAEDLVRMALERNGELAAARTAIGEAKGRLRQASYRANPMLETSGKQAVTSTDNNQMISIELPLEIGGRRQARVTTGQREVDLRQAEVADFERKLASEVRMKYASVIAIARNLKLAEDMVLSTQNSHQLVRARVDLGKSSLLEQNELWVEVNRVDASRLNLESSAERAMLELKQAVGSLPEEPLKLRGEFAPVTAVPTMAETLQRAMTARPDLIALRAGERLAEAQIEQARREGRVDASLFAGYERMSNGYDVMGFNASGRLVPVNAVFHYATFGVRFTLPVRNKNQGLIEAAVAASEAARHRREFAELVVRNEVASAIARLEKARSVLGIFRERVLEPAQRNLEVVRKTYAIGYRPALDYLAEQRRYIEVETDYTRALQEYLEALAELDRTTGVILGKDRQ